MKNIIIRVLVVIVGVAAGVAIHWVGYVQGRQRGDVQAYLIGFEQGQADGMSTAQAAYESGGEIVNITTGQRTKKPKQSQ